MLLMWEQMNCTLYYNYKISQSLINFSKILYDVKDRNMANDILEYCKNKYIKYLDDVSYIYIYIII